MQRRDPLHERQRTDEALHEERTRTDQEMTARAAAAGGTADEVIRVARERAQEVLDNARVRSEHDAPISPEQALARSREDELLATEYAAADRALDDERLRRQLAIRQLLAVERLATDEMLTRERASVDARSVDRAVLDLLVHDLRSMLSTVSLNAATIVIAADKGEPVRLLVDLASNIQRAVAQVDILLGDLQELAAIESGRARVLRAETELVDLVRTAVDIHHAAAEANGVTLAVALPAPPLVVSIDAPRVMRVLINVIANALKFTPRGGSVTVEATRLAGAIEIAIADTGPGIPAELRESIFDRFCQGVDAHGRGLGLGLYIARTIVEAHGGRIWVDGDSRRGATFRIHLPA